jgi:outer membrane biosynthesis protein TonB
MPILLPLLALTLTAAADGGAPDKAPDLATMPFTPDSITQVMRAHQTEIQTCYEKTLAARDEKLSGSLMTRFVITAAGTVKGAQVVKKGTTLKDKDLHACVVGVLKKLTFPKPPDAKDHPVDYPVNLQAVE